MQFSSTLKRSVTSDGGLGKLDSTQKLDKTKFPFPSLSLLTFRTCIHEAAISGKGGWVMGVVCSKGQCRVNLCLRIGQPSFASLVYFSSV